MLDRRQFLRVAGVGLVVTACAPARLAPPAPRRLPPAAAGGAPAAGDPLLVVIFQRGGADGLHVVPPLSDPDYERLRGELALSDALPFERGFGLHPALAPLAPLHERGELAVVHAAGSPHPTRSHFEAQDFMEAGEPGTHRLRTGWLARALADEPRGAFASLALGAQLPLSLRGSGSFAVEDASQFGVFGASPETREALAALYARAETDPVAAAGREALSALDEYERVTGESASFRRYWRGRRRGGAPLAEAVRQLLALDEAGLRIEVAVLESDGWDTHLRQGVAQGRMARSLSDLGTALAALAEGTRGRRDLRAVVMTEFGRTVRPNGSGGSDHGHGSAMLVAGPGVRGGLHGEWPGLRDPDLWEGRDLAVTTDYRAVLWEVLAAHLRRAPAPDTFPGFAPRRLGLFAS